MRHDIKRNSAVDAEASQVAGEVWTHLSLIIPPVKGFSLDLSSSYLPLTTNLFINHRQQRLRVLKGSVQCGGIRGMCMCEIWTLNLCVTVNVNNGDCVAHQSASCEWLHLVSNKWLRFVLLLVNSCAFLTMWRTIIDRTSPLTLTVLWWAYNWRMFGRLHYCWSSKCSSLLKTMLCFKPFK